MTVAAGSVWRILPIHFGNAKDVPGVVTRHVGFNFGKNVGVGEQSFDILPGP